MSDEEMLEAIIYIQRVLASKAPKQDRIEARYKAVSIRKELFYRLQNKDILKDRGIQDV